MRAQVEGGGPAVARPAQQPGRRGVGGVQRGERGGDGRVRLDRPEQQQPHQHPERGPVGGGAERGFGLAPAERGVRLAAEQRPHAVGAVVGALERGAQGVGGGGGHLGQHAPILADAPRGARRRGGRGTGPSRIRWTDPLIGGAVLQLAQDPDADALLDRDPLALLIGMLLDQQFPMERAFAGPAGLARRLGVDHLDARALAEHDPEALAAVFTGPPALHRYPRRWPGGCRRWPRWSSTATTATPPRSGATSPTAPPSCAGSRRCPGSARRRRRSSSRCWASSAG